MYICDNLCMYIPSKKYICMYICNNFPLWWSSHETFMGRRVTTLWAPISAPITLLSTSHPHLSLWIRSLPNLASFWVRLIVYLTLWSLHYRIKLNLWKLQSMTLLIRSEWFFICTLLKLRPFQPTNPPVPHMGSTWRYLKYGTSGGWVCL